MKLFASILDSSIWGEDLTTRVVWITMLAMADRDGLVRASDDGLARRANVPVPALREALAVLESPDLQSKSKAWAGRRVERVDEGWLILNYASYRDLRDADLRREQVREAVRRHRERAAASPEDVIIGKPPSAHTDAEAASATDAEDPPVGPPAPRGGMTLVPRRVADITGWVDGALQAALEGVARDTASRTARERLFGALEAFVFAYAQKRWGHEGALLDPKRQRYLHRALVANGGNVHILLYAADGALKDDVIAGRRDDSPKGGYLRISTVYRDQEQVERLARLAGYEPGKVHRMAEAHGLKVVA